MSDLEKAAHDAVEAADNAEQLKLITAVLAAQQLLAAQQEKAAPPAAPHREFPVAQWLVIGGVVTVAGTAAAFVALALAVAVIATVVFGSLGMLVLRQLLRDLQRKG